MTPDEYRATLAKLNLTQVRAATLLGVNARSSQRWALGEREIPPPTARFLQWLYITGADPEAVIREFVDEPNA